MMSAGFMGALRQNRSAAGGQGFAIMEPHKLQAGFPLTPFGMGPRDRAPGELDYGSGKRAETGDPLRRGRPAKHGELGLFRLRVGVRPLLFHAGSPHKRRSLGSTMK